MLFRSSFTPQRGMPDIGTAAALKKTEDVLRRIINQAVADGELSQHKSENFALMIGALNVFYSTSLLSGDLLKFSDKNRVRELLSDVVACGKVSTLRSV